MFDMQIATLWPSHPAAGKAGIAPLFPVDHHRPGLPEPGRSSELGLRNETLRNAAPNRRSAAFTPLHRPPGFVRPRSATTMEAEAA